MCVISSAKLKTDQIKNQKSSKKAVKRGVEHDPLLSYIDLIINNMERARAFDTFCTFFS